MAADPKIISIEYAGEMEDVGAAACKAMPPGRRYRYKRATKYTLEDGSVYEGCVRGETRPKMLASFERNDRYIKEGALFAIIQNGEFVGTKMVFSLVR
jgi:hypothetical protein